MGIELELASPNEIVIRSTDGGDDNSARLLGPAGELLSNSVIELISTGPKGRLHIRRRHNDNTGSTEWEMRRVKEARCEWRVSYMEEDAAFDDQGCLCDRARTVTFTRVSE